MVRCIICPSTPCETAVTASTLATRFELVVAPSATLWRHWREKTPRADDTDGCSRLRTRCSMRTASSIERRDAQNAAQHSKRGLRLARLPYARRESRAIARYLGERRDAPRIVGIGKGAEGAGPSDTTTSCILRTHAIADEGRTRALGGAARPGAAKRRWPPARPAKSKGLNLDGRIVVLSACETASGAILNGEGVLSLARAFFAAGAKTVIGTRWPIRDNDAAALFEAFYQRLGEGASLSEALKQAKAQAIEAKQPVAAWASLVLLGDGDFRPFPGGRPRPPAKPGPSPSLVALFAVEHRRPRLGTRSRRPASPRRPTEQLSLPDRSEGILRPERL